MAFKASKIRMKLPVKPIGIGTPIVPSAAITKWYFDKITPYSDAMVDDYRKEFENLFKKGDVKEFYAMDVSIASLFKNLLKSLEMRWSKIFTGLSAQIAPDFVGKAEEQATITTLFSVSAAGVNEPKAVYNESIKNTLQASVEYNKTLITNIAAEAHYKIYNSVMLSLTSPNPEEQGMAGIKKALIDIGIKDKKRIKLICEDQTAKLYASVAINRMAENGVEEFEWMHSSAGKVPRKTHVEKNGNIYKINDPRLWEGPKSDQGPPGWAIHCRCRMRPIV